jgi:hypothetical protein
VIPRGLASLATGLGLLLALGGGFSIADAAGPVATTTPARSIGPRAPPPAGNSPGLASADSNQDIRDIHGPIALVGRRSPWWYAGGAAIVIGAISASVLHSRRRRPNSPAHQRALRALEEAGTSFAGDSRQFSFAVSEIVRRYVEEAFRVRASHRTTEELLVDLMLDRSAVALHRTALGEFLRYCDLAKFAGWSLSPADRIAMLASAKAFILATTAPASPEPVHTAALRGEGIA